MMKHVKVVGLCLASATFAAVMLGLGANPDDKFDLDGLSREQVATHFTVDDGAEQRLFQIAEKMSNEELEAEVRNLYSQWQEEERWASFLQCLMLHMKEHDEFAYLKWQKNWSDLTGGLWIYSNMHGFRARQLLKTGDFEKFSYQDIYASLSVLLPKIREARLALATGVMNDVMSPGKAEMFIEPWVFQLEDE